MGKRLIILSALVLFLASASAQQVQRSNTVLV